MPIRFYIPLPGPFVWVPRRRVRRPAAQVYPGSVLAGVLIFVALLAALIVSWVTTGYPSEY